MNAEKLLCDSVDHAQSGMEARRRRAGQDSGTTAGEMKNGQRKRRQRKSAQGIQR